MVNHAAPSQISVIDVVSSRRSIRQFLDRPVPLADVQSILSLASRAPSGQNMQPWYVHIVTGETRENLRRSVTMAATRGERSDEYDYLPDIIKEPYLLRRRKVGFDLFSIYGIAKEDMAGRQKAQLRNFDFFGAPVGLFFLIDRDSGQGAWIDCAMFMMNVMNVAPAFDLETCPQQAWCEYGKSLREVLAIPDNKIVISGMALGYADQNARENHLITDRAPVDYFTTYHQ